MNNKRRSVVLYFEETTEYIDPSDCDCTDCFIGESRPAWSEQEKEMTQDGQRVKLITRVEKHYHSRF